MTFRIQQAHSMSQVLQNDGPNMNMVSSYTILGSLGPFRAVLPGHFALKLPRHGGKKGSKRLKSPRVSGSSVSRCCFGAPMYLGCLRQSSLDLKLLIS